MKEKEQETKRVKRKKFYILFLFMMLSLLLVMVSSIQESFIKLIAEFLILLVQYLSLDAMLTDYFGE